MCQDVHPLSFLQLNLWDATAVRSLRIRVWKLRIEKSQQIDIAICVLCTSSTAKLWVRLGDNLTSDYKNTLPHSNALISEERPTVLVLGIAAFRQNL